MSERPPVPVRHRGAKVVPLQVNDTLMHPMAEGVGINQRSRWKYKFLRTIRLPTLDRPDSGRILVENELTGVRKEFYAILFGIGFKAA